ncbi:hypothetical protein ACQEU3_09575 [Spirillospora sp. CA-253888]
MIQKSPLGLKTPAPTGTKAQGVFIANAWKSVNVTKIGWDLSTGKEEPTQRLPVMPDLLKPTDKLEKSTVRLLGEKLKEHDPAKARADYLQWGLAQARGDYFYSRCDEFACVSIALLIARGSPVPKGTRVELCGRRATEGSHAFAVVGRASGGSIADPSTWGDACVVVDQWYALQAGVPGAFFINGPGPSTDYKRWLAATKSGNNVVVAEFTAGADPTFRLPEKYLG